MFKHGLMNPGIIFNFLNHKRSYNFTFIFKYLSNIGEIIECQTEINIAGLARELSVFGIGRIASVDNLKVSPEQVRYWFYPRHLKNSTYLDHVVFVNGVSHDLVLYYSADEITDSVGMRVKNLECWKTLVKMFDQISTNQTMLIDVGDSQAISMLGEVLLSVTEIYKRWRRFGWGLGLGFTDFGW